MNNHRYIGFIGTYTKGESKGIYRFSLNTDEMKIQEITAAATLENPTYLTISKNNHYLYAVAKEADKGGIAAFSLSSSSAELTPINSQLSAGASPCYVSVDSQNHAVFSANYHRGTIEAHLINPDTGAVLPASSVIKHEGSGPDRRQEKAHTHYADVTPDGKFVVAVELGSDAVITYSHNDSGTIHEVCRLAVTPGSGPRHIVFHPTERFAYVMTEFSSEVILLSYDSANGKFEEIQYYSTLPKDFKENNQGSAIRISSDGRFVYAGNRGHNSIAIFQVNQDSGELSFVDRTSTEGDWPRDFSLDPSENFLLVSNQESSNLVLFSRNKESGRLTLQQSDVKVPNPVCVKFLHV